jgi:endoglycosylceramidase
LTAKPRWVTNDSSMLRSALATARAVTAQLTPAVVLVGVVASTARCSGSTEVISTPEAGMEGDAARGLQAPKLNSFRLGTRGDALVDELGRTVLLRGVNVGGRSKMPPDYMPFEVSDTPPIAVQARTFMSAVRGLGVNALRLVFSWEALEPVRGSFDAEYLSRYRALLDAAHEAELRVVIDFHQDVFQAAFCGDGFPEWALGDIPHGPPHYDCNPLSWSFPYFDVTSGVSQAFDRLWNNRDGLLDSFEAMWRHVAREVGGHPAVSGFDVINEPGAGSQAIEVVGSTVLPPLYDRIAAAIETASGPAVILGEEPVSATPGMSKLVRPQHARFAYAPHYYDFATTAGGFTQPEQVRAAVSEMLSRGKSFAAPVVLGEFGSPNSVPHKADFLTTIYDALDTYRASGMVWEASASDMLWNGEDFSALNADRSEKAWVSAADRPYPRAIDGTITALTWDAVAKRFELNVESGGEIVSEVYLPARHLGASPRITLTGARWRWSANTRTLLVAGTPGAPWSLVAEAESVAP